MSATVPCYHIEKAKGRVSVRCFPCVQTHYTLGKHVDYYPDAHTLPSDGLLDECGEKQPALPNQWETLEELFRTRVFPQLLLRQEGESDPVPWPKISPPPPLKLPARKRREPIRQPWHTDPLRCPVCFKQKRLIIAVANSPPVVEKTRRKMNLWRGPAQLAPPVHRLQGILRRRILISPSTPIRCRTKIKTYPIDRVPPTRKLSAMSKKWSKNAQKKPVELPFSASRSLYALALAFSTFAV